MFRKKGDALWTEVAGQVLLLSTETGQYYEATGIGRAVWELLETPRSKANIVSLIVQQYRIGPEECARDVGHFLEKLVSASLIVHDDAVPPDGNDASGPRE